MEQKLQISTTFDFIYVNNIFTITPFIQNIPNNQTISVVHIDNITASCNTTTIKTRTKAKSNKQLFKQTNKQSNKDEKKNKCGAISRLN